MTYLYPVFLTFHIFCAIMFVGTVFFEVLILERIRQVVSPRMMAAMESAVGRTAPALMKWVFLFLFGSGVGMVWLRYIPLLSHPLASSFALMLTIKIVLAVSVLGHFVVALLARRRQKLSGAFFKYLHLSIFTHVVCIVLLAKWMFYIA